MKERLVLASTSPRRKELLQSAGVEFDIVKSDFEEQTDGKYSPIETVKLFAKGKAEDVFKKTGRAALGADTVVVYDGKIIGKPKNEADAKRILSELSGNVHEVVTGIAVVTENKTVVDAVVTKVYFNDLTEEFIDGYVSSGTAMDKAGAYGIQDGGFAKNVEGSFTNVIGLPMERTEEILKELHLWQEKK